MWRVKKNGLPLLDRKSIDQVCPWPGAWPREIWSRRWLDIWLPVREIHSRFPSPALRLDSRAEPLNPGPLPRTWANEQTTNWITPRSLQTCRASSARNSAFRRRTEILGKNFRHPDRLFFFVLNPLDNNSIHSARWSISIVSLIWFLLNKIWNIAVMCFFFFKKQIRISLALASIATAPFSNK